MAHEEYVRILPEADTAVLFIHGIVGTPEHFRTLIPLERVVPEDWSVYNLILPGHGGTALDFGKSSMDRWKEKVWRVFEELAVNHRRIVIVGHSMGALFALQLAQAFPGKVARLFLLAAPMRPYLGVNAAANSLRLTFHRLRPDRPRETAIALACGSELTMRLWVYLRWLPRFAELFREVRITEKMLGTLTVACESWQSGRDELVMASSVRVLNDSGRVEVRLLPESSHFYYAPTEREEIVRAFSDRCAELKK